MTREIPPIEWKQFFDNLSRDLSDCVISIEIVPDKKGSRYLVRDVPFAVALVASNDHLHNQIVFLLEGRRNTHETHSIQNPQRVSFLQNKNLPGCLVAVKSADGTKTMIHIHRPLPALPGFAERLTVPNIY
jgi:hypothetical protein